ncbi:NAD(P)-dependent oxidoreductase [Veillonella atypica]
MMNERVVVVNASKMNYDHLLDFSVLSNDVQVYDDSTNEEVIERIQGARVVVTKELPVGAELLSQFPESVKLIVEAGTGYNNIDLDAARAKGITVCNIPAYSTERVAHTVIMMLLNFSSTMQQQIGMLAKGDRSNFTKHLQVSHTEVNGKTLGVVGAGHIGMEVIKVAKALGMNILIHTRTPKADGDGIRYVSLDELLEHSDYITLHCPLNEQTKHMINKDTIAKMKSSAVIINTGRGALINEADLCEALVAKRIAGAGLDVQEVEPPVEDSPLYTLDNVIITPHMGWKGLETRQRLVGIIRDNVQAFLKGEPINVVS